MRTIVIAISLFLSCLHADGKYAWEWMKEQQFSDAYKKAIIDHTDIRWLVDLPGPSHKSKMVKIDNEDWHLIWSCKPHDCAKKNVRIFYNTNNWQLYGIVKNDETFFIGQPDQAMKTRLLELE